MLLTYCKSAFNCSSLGFVEGKARILINRMSCADTWPQAMAIMARPRNVSAALSLLYDLIDGIWALSGDQSSDATWYTKRLALQALYTSTELYMLSDKSPGHQDTWDALKRRMQDVERAGQGLQTAQTAAMELANRMKVFG